MASHSEKLDMVLVFNECHRKSRQSAQLYAERYPNKYQTAHNYFLRLENQIRTYGSFGNRGNLRQIPQVQAEVNEETVIQILVYVQINPRSSIRHVENEIEINPRKAVAA